MAHSRPVHEPCSEVVALPPPEAAEIKVFEVGRCQLKGPSKEAGATSSTLRIYDDDTLSWPSWWCFSLADRSNECEPHTTSSRDQAATSH